MKKSLWLSDPKAWSEMSLPDQLEMLRIYFCTGPCGQSGTVVNTRAALDIALKTAIHEIRTHS